MTHLGSGQAKPRSTVPGRPGAARLVDPEDDLTPVGYPGEFGTTAVIPYHDPNQSATPGSPGYNLLDQQEPLPYVQPQPAARLLSGRAHRGRVRTRTTSGNAPSVGAAPSTSVC